MKEENSNCILNSENQGTQKDLFTNDDVDMVDYFEISCFYQKPKKKFGNRDSSNFLLFLFILPFLKILKT